MSDLGYMTTLGWAALVVLGYMTIVWIVSVLKKDTSIVDVAWGAGFVVAAGVFYFLSGGWEPRKLLVLAMVAVWGLRLSLHIGMRNHGRPEDKRYAAWRSNHPKTWWWRSYFTVFLLQGALLLIISLPLLSAQTSAMPQDWRWLDLLGLGLWSVGFMFEAIADQQLYQFRQNPDNQNKVMNSGLWRYSRHPNYFGEAVVWWGFFVMAVQSGHVWVIVSPILITTLLLKFSGVTLLEKDLKDSKPGYRDYIRSTNAFFPWLPKSYEGLEPVDNVNLDRFMGDWYVVANIPSVIEKGAVNAVESYSLRDDGNVDIAFSYDKEAGDNSKTLTGTGYVVDNKSNAEWRVQFFWPVKFPYVIVHLDDEYQSTIIGYPDHKYLWIMTRDPNPDEARLKELIDAAVDCGYDRERIQRVTQDRSHDTAKSSS